MTFPLLRAALYTCIGIALTEGSARALVRLNDGTDQIYVDGSFSLGHASNLSDSAGGASDYSYGASVELEYQRHAGLITVNASATYTLTDYLNKADRVYDSFNPSYSVEFDKGSGRTTGALTLSAARSSQADAEANVHDVSWDYGLGLNFKYPVIERYAFSGSLNYSYLDYTETSGQPLVNLSTLGASLGLFYILDDEHDLFATYRYRFQATSASTSSDDDAYMFGVSGKIIGEIDGTISAGYQVRYPHGTATVAGIGDQYAYHDITGSASLTWHANRKLSFTGSANKDFNTTATNATTDTTSGTLDAGYAYSSAWQLKAGIGGGEVRYLGLGGLIPDTDLERRDYYFTWNAGISYALNEHLHADFVYTFLRNWSNLALATFTNEGWTLTLSTRW